MSSQVEQSLDVLIVAIHVTGSCWRTNRYFQKGQLCGRPRRYGRHWPG